MEYVLTGFSFAAGKRVFAFDCVEKDRSRTEFRVTADLSLLRAHGIRVQELPLLCRGVLERRDPAEERKVFDYSELQMSEYASQKASREADAQLRKPVRRPPRPNMNPAWRGMAKT